MSRPARTRRIAVYDGSRMIGRVVEADNRRGYEAYGTDDVAIGIFPDTITATKAVCERYDRLAAERHRLIRAH